MTLLKLINNSSSQLQITACIPQHVHVFGYLMKNWMKIFKDLDLDTISKYPLILGKSRDINKLI